MTFSNFQNSWPENLFVLRIKSIEKLSTFELMCYWYLSPPKRRKKWTLFSTLKLHEQSGLMQSLKLWLNLWSLRWLKPNQANRWANNFNPVGLRISYVLLHLGLIKFNILFLNIKYDSDDFTILSKLFYSFTVYGKNVFLKSSV